ncbi:MAG: PilN domain-containing protein, partial [Nitrobacter sp.]
MATLENWLIEHGIARERAIIGLVIPTELFFVRELTVPRAAFGALSTILDQEVLRRTPFQLSEIWHEAMVSGEDANDVVAMRHWIIRKDRAEAALSELGLTSSAIDHLAISGTNGEAVPVITFRADQHDDPAWALRAVRLLAAAALGAALLGLGAFEWRQASVAGAVEASLAEARQGAQSGRDGVDPTARLFAMKTEAGILDVWDELSRILPDHTFLTEVRLADGKVTLAGFSADAARLVRLIDQSPLF